MIRCIAMGRGQASNPHFHFLDIDAKGQGIIDTLRSLFPYALLYETTKGYHVINSSKILSPATMPLLAPYYDYKCPFNAVRIYPYFDYKMIQMPEVATFCPRVINMYEMIFNRDFGDCKEDCSHGLLKFGVYSRDEPIGEPDSKST